METNLKVRVKTTAGQVTPGNTFRLIEKMQCFMVLDLTKKDMFAEAVPGKELPILRTDVVYVVDVATGIVEVIGKSISVYEIKLKAEEVD